MTEATERMVRQTLLALLEATLSLVMVGMVLWFPFTSAVANACFFGDCSGPTPDDVRFYRVSAGVFAAVTVAVFLVAHRRGARGAYFWHALVAVTGAASAIAFQVPDVDWAEQFRDEPPPTNPDYVPCYSGGSSDCPGG